MGKKERREIAAAAAAAPKDDPQEEQQDLEAGQRRTRRESDRDNNGVEANETLFLLKVVAARMEEHSVRMEQPRSTILTSSDSDISGMGSESGPTTILANNGSMGGHQEEQESSETTRSRNTRIIAAATLSLRLSEEDMEASEESQVRLQGSLVDEVPGAYRVQPGADGVRSSRIRNAPMQRLSAHYSATSQDRVVHNNVDAVGRNPARDDNNTSCLTRSESEPRTVQGANSLATPPCQERQEDTSEKGALRKRVLVVFLLLLLSGGALAIFLALVMDSSNSTPSVLSAAAGLAQIGPTSSPTLSATPIPSPPITTAPSSSSSSSSLASIAPFMASVDDDSAGTEITATSALPACAFSDDTETHTGYVEMHVQDLSSSLDSNISGAKEDLEELFRQVYNNITAMCLDPYGRTLTLDSVNLTSSYTTTAQDGWEAASTETHWTADVTCNGCPSYEPLFEEPSSEVVDRWRRQFEEPLLFDLASEFLPLFASTFGYHLRKKLSQANGTARPTITYIASRSYEDKADTAGTIEGGGAFVVVQVIGAKVIQGYDEYVASLEGLVEAPFATQRIADIRNCYNDASTFNTSSTSPLCREVAKRVTSPPTLSLCLDNVLTLECQDLLDPLFDAYTPKGSLALPSSPNFDVVEEILPLSASSAVEPQGPSLSPPSGSSSSVPFTTTSSPVAIAPFDAGPTVAPGGLSLTTFDSTTQASQSPQNSPILPTESPSLLMGLVREVTSTIPTIQPTNTNIPPLAPRPSLSSTLAETPRPTQKPTLLIDVLGLTPLPTRQLSNSPTVQTIPNPAPEPTPEPSPAPTRSRTPRPTGMPTQRQTPFPTQPPTRPPTQPPTQSPTLAPPTDPSPTADAETMLEPSKSPKTAAPTVKNSASPSFAFPSTHPSPLGSSPPTMDSDSPRPSSPPSMFPSDEADYMASIFPSFQPSMIATTIPNFMPTRASVTSSGPPSTLRSKYPSVEPTTLQSDSPSVLPSALPSLEPTKDQSDLPSAMPSAHPNSETTIRPSNSPSPLPSVPPSMEPTTCPSDSPSPLPSVPPSMEPTTCPSDSPSPPLLALSGQPSTQPSLLPSFQPSLIPSTSPSAMPTAQTCFSDRADLDAAILSDYGDSSGTTFLTYGPIRDWCFDRINFDSLFEGSSFNDDISGWQVSKIRSMEEMFKDSSFNQPIGSWDVSNVWTFVRTFQSSIFNQDISAWDVSSVLAFGQLFNNNVVFNQPLNDWDISGVSDLLGVFDNARAFNHPLDGWDVQKVTTMKYTFKSAVDFDQPLSSWVTSNAEILTSMFYLTDKFDSDISAWDVAGVTSMANMFRDALLYDQPLASWDTSAVREMQHMFAGSPTFNQDISGWNIDQVTDFFGMFEAAGAFDKNLCLWGNKIGIAGTTPIVMEMFRGANMCPNTADPDLTAVPIGPFCYTCP